MESIRFVPYLASSYSLAPVFAQDEDGIMLLLFIATNRKYAERLAASSRPLEAQRVDDSLLASFWHSSGNLGLSTSLGRSLRSFSNGPRSTRTVSEESYTAGKALTERKT